METMQVVIFSLNDEICAVNTFQVKEIVKYEGLTDNSTMFEFVDGIINLRGEVVPIVNLNKRFKQGETEITRQTKIIIAEIGEKKVGFVVNDVQGISTLSSDQIESTPELVRKNNNSYVTSVGKKDGKIISILDFANILSKDELNLLN